MSKSKVFLYFCLFFVLGVGLRSFFNISSFASYFVFLIGLVIVVFNVFKIRQLALLIISLSLGILIYNIQLPKKDQSKIYFYNNQKITCLGVVIKEPEIKIDKQRLVVEAKEIFINKKWRKVSGRVLLTSGLYPKYNYGDLLKISGELKPPEKIEDFNYANYLFPDKIYSLTYYPEIKVLDYGKGNMIMAEILKLKEKFQLIINSSLLEPQASLFSALTLGNRAAIPFKLTDTFRKAGISHVIAISGLHTAIIGLILFNLFLLLYIPKKYSFYFSSFLLFLFVILTGARSSVIRAGIMGFLLLWAVKEGRLNKSLNVIAFTAAIMLVFNPYLLRFDLGFQLSFSAILGIIYLYPFFDKLNFFKKIPDYLRLKSIFLVSISAQLATLPLIIYYFRQFSIFSPLTNLFVLPILPLVMTLGFLFLLLGLIYLPLAKILFFVIYLLLTYLIKVAELV